MKLVVGLGNPGTKYAETRHNAGFWVIDELADQLSVRCDKQKWQALVGEARIGTERVLLVKPQTFMNLSGQSVREILTFYSDLNPEADVIAVYDDMDFPTGQMKLREKGSAGGHNGVKSLISHLGTTVFPRVRLGIGRPEVGEEVIHYVLSPVPREQRPAMQAMVKRACEAVQCAVTHSFTLAMNRYNEQSPQ